MADQGIYNPDGSLKTSYRALESPEMRRLGGGQGLMFQLWTQAPAFATFFTSYSQK